MDVQKYPKARITGLSNSATQKAYIDSTAKKRGLTNVKVTRRSELTFDFY